MTKMNNYLLTESLVSTISVYMILRKLMTDFKDWDAHKLGIIDTDGKKLKNPVTSKEREAWDILTRLCWNIKKISYKFIGKSKFASYFTAAYLLKDSLSYFYIEHNLEKLNETILVDMTCAKQTNIYNSFKVIRNNTETISETITEANLEVMMFKYLHTIENVINLKELQDCLFEDGEAPASSPSAPVVSSDIAKADYRVGSDQTSPRQKLGILKRSIKKKTKKRKPHENNQ